MSTAYGHQLYDASFDDRGTSGPHGSYRSDVYGGSRNNNVLPMPEFYSSPSPMCSGYTTVGTTSLTPSTIASIEHSLLSLERSDQSHMYTSQRDGYLTSSPHQSTSIYSSPSAWAHTVDDKLSRGPVIIGQPPPQPKRKGGRKPKNDPLPPMEAEKRRLRRLRNKEAAAKCRQRRMEHTTNLMQQIEELEKHQRAYSMEISKLQQAKEQCEFVLQSHRTQCTKFPASTSVTNRRKQIAPTPRLQLDTCAASHRRSSSSSSSDLQSPTIILP